MTYQAESIQIIKHPEWINNSTIYEVNLRQFSSSGTFREFEKHLPRLKALGIGILWFMPIHPVGIKNRKGELGSYYSVRNYITIDESYGTIEEFKELVKKIHEMGMYVILDWVANHTSWDHIWTIDHPEFYSKNSEGHFTPPFPEWEDVIQLNYDNYELWQSMIDAMKFWIKETNIDGFRCDMAHLVRTSFWNEARKQLSELKTIFMLAESENKDLLISAFDALYNWKIYHTFNEIVKKEKSAKDLYSIMENEFLHFPKTSFQMLFTSNHDENSWNGSAIERLGPAIQSFTVLTFTLPGIPLIYSGQEAGNPKQLCFFDKDEINWKEDKISDLYTILSKLKKENKALWAGENGGRLRIINNSKPEFVFSYVMERNGDRVLVIINLSNYEQEFLLNDKACVGRYQNAINGEFCELFSQKIINLKSWNYLIYAAI